MARTQSYWQTGPGGGYIYTIAPAGYDILINGTNKYLNFNTTVGFTGYGIRDNNGVMEFKNSGGAWAGIGTGGSGGTGTVTSVASADGSITVTNPTTAVDLAVVKSPQLTNPRTISTIGDVTYTSSPFDGTANATGTATLATVNSNVGSFGSSTSIPSFTVNAKGLITAAAGNVVIAPAGTLTGNTLASNVLTSSLTTVGTIGTGVWQGTKVGLTYGGTNADLSATGGTSQVLKQSSSGAAITVGTLALTNLSDTAISSPSVDQILKYNGSSWVNGASAVVNAGTGVEFYYTTTASDISTYKQVTRAPQSVAEQDITVTANNNTVLFFAYSSPSTGLGSTSIDAGTWSFDVYAYASLLTLESHIVLDVYSRTTGGTETLLFSVNSGTLSSTLQLFQITSIQQAFTINPTDRLIIKVSGATSNISNTTVHFVFGGTTHYSNVTTPLVTRHNDLAGLQGGTGSGTTGEYYHLTSAEYTGTGTGVFVRASAPQISTIELGNASDTTLSRSAAGQIAVEGVDVLTTSNTKTVTNKTLDNTNTVALKDNLFTLQDDGDVTKQAQFNLSGNTTGTTKTYNFPSITPSSDTLMGIAAVQVVTNKTLIATTNVVEEATTTASSSTPTPTGGSLRNFFTVTALATNATFAAPSGTPADGSYLTIRVKDNGTARTLAWNAIYRAGDVALSTTTVISKTQYFNFRYNSADSKWDYLAQNGNF